MQIVEFSVINDYYDELHKFNLTPLKCINQSEHIIKSKKLTSNL